jgi:hypothetical protein
MQTLQIYIAPSGQYAGRMIEDGQELFGIAGCSTPEEVEQAACDAGAGAYQVELDEPLAGIVWWNELTEQTRMHWLTVACSGVPADAYRAYLASTQSGLDL